MTAALDVKERTTSVNDKITYAAEVRASVNVILCYLFRLVF